jgi:hypothetical protein
VQIKVLRTVESSLNFFYFLSLSELTISVVFTPSKYETATGSRTFATICVGLAVFNVRQLLLAPVDRELPNLQQMETYHNERALVSNSPR